MKPTPDVTPKKFADMIQDECGKEFTCDLIEALQEVNKCPEGVCDGSGLVNEPQWDENTHQYINTGDMKKCVCTLED